MLRLSFSRGYNELSRFSATNQTLQMKIRIRIDLIGRLAFRKVLNPENLPVLSVSKECHRDEGSSQSMQGSRACPRSDAYLVLQSAVEALRHDLRAVMTVL